MGIHLHKNNKGGTKWDSPPRRSVGSYRYQCCIAFYCPNNPKPQWEICCWIYWWLQPSSPRSNLATLYYLRRRNASWCRSLGCTIHFDILPWSVETLGTPHSGWIPIRVGWVPRGPRFHCSPLLLAEILRSNYKNVWYVRWSYGKHKAHMFEVWHPPKICMFFDFGVLQHIDLYWSYLFFLFQKLASQDPTGTPTVAIYVKRSPTIQIIQTVTQTFIPIGAEMLHIESFEAALYTQLVVNSTCDGTWSMLHRTSSLPQAIYIPRCSTMRPWLPGWHLRQLSWKSMVCRPSVGFGVFRAGDSFLNLCGLWRMGHPYKLGFKKVIWPSDQGNDFFWGMNQVGIFLGFPSKNNVSLMVFVPWGIYPDLLHILDLAIYCDMYASAFLVYTDDNSLFEGRSRDERLQKIYRLYVQWCADNRVSS